MSLSKEQWQVIEKQLSFPYSKVKLKCDEYEVSAVVEKIKGLKFCVTVYVDGVYRGEWMDGKHEQPLKFHRKMRRYFLNGKKRQYCIRELSKRGIPAASKKMYRKWLDQYHEYWVPFFPSARSFCRHIQKTCTNIELID